MILTKTFKIKLKNSMESIHIQLQLFSQIQCSSFVSACLLLPGVDPLRQISRKNSGFCITSLISPESMLNCFWQRSFCL